MSTANEKDVNNQSDKAMTNKARREKIEKLGLAIKNAAIQAKDKAMPIIQKAIPVVQKGVDNVVDFVKSKLKKK
jgi:hypothetical protein